MRYTTLGLLVAMSFAGVANAKMPMADEMMSGMTMLQSAADQVLKSYGFKEDSMGLTLSQLFAIQAALESSNSEGDTKAAIANALKAK